jgi:Cdc6-like AAA superfamily ATPase
MDLDQELEGFADYANDDVRALFNSFNTDDDRKWAWFVLSELRKRFPRLNHRISYIQSNERFEIAIGVHSRATYWNLAKEKNNAGVVGLWRWPERSKFGELLSFEEGDWWMNSDYFKEEAKVIERLDYYQNLIEENEIPMEGKSLVPKTQNSKVQLEDSGNKNMPSEFKSVQNLSLNTILYGPPGTGKTYHTINKALEIIDPNFYSSHQDKDERETLKERFNELCKENKIVMTTFHQSYSYEDFVEGLSAESIDEKLVYGIKDGIFKKIAQNANSQHTSNFEDVYIKLCNDIEENGLTLKTLKRNKPIDIEVSTQQNLVVIPQTETKTRMTITKENLRQLILNGVVGDWSTYTRVIKKYLEDHYNLTTQFQKSNYVLIIDEINRGNVSNIFGELITLIEESKREGKDEALSARLPYSKKPFSVPSNLYIIGTMNTADRSLTQIDTALRRRFHFEEMMPQPELLDSIVIDGIEVDKLLRCLNARIEALYDREHTLGHAFFIELKEDGKNNIETLARIFKNKIIPLLQEYFFDDWGKIQLILGEQVIKEKAQFSNFATPNINNLVIPKTYEIVSGTLKEPDTYITMYKNCLSV